MGGGILKILMKMGALWCNLENVLHKIKDHLRKLNKELHVA